MPQRLRAVKRFQNFNFPVSYKIGASDRMNDAKNVCSIQDVLETRHGVSRYNAIPFSAPPLSISYFESDNGSKYLIAKDGTTLYLVSKTGAHTAIKTGLSATTKHRGVTIRNRHFIFIASDGIFSWNGTIFTQVGQEPLGAPSVAASGSGNTLTAKDYQVAVTGYMSAFGFESNIGTQSSTVTVSSAQQIDITNIPSTAANGFIDKIRIYLKNVTDEGPWLFWNEISLGVTIDTIDSDPTSTQEPPTKNAKPQTGGGKYPIAYGQSLAYAGNGTFQSDVFISEGLLPDAYDDTGTGKTFNISGNGPITGLGLGYYNNSNQAPYIVAFKRNHIELFTEISGFPEQIVISKDVGCVSHDTISTINGDIYFLSTQGWHVISNGRIRQDKNKSNTIDNGDIRDIFSRSGFEHELNKSDMKNFFSVYYPTLDQYITFVSEGSGTSKNRAYNFEFEIGGFRPYEWADLSFTDAVLGGDSTGDDIIYLSGTGGYIYTHSIAETQGTDVDSYGNDLAIAAMARLFWQNGFDMESSYNFGPFTLRAYDQANPITVKFYLGYSDRESTDKSYDFSTDAGFTLDISQLDVGVLDGRSIVNFYGEILRTSSALLIEFYKEQAGESMSLIEGQLDVSKNGNPN